MLTVNSRIEDAFYKDFKIVILKVLEYVCISCIKASNYYQVGKMIKCKG